MIKTFVLHPETPNKRDIQMIATMLKEGAIGIIPTDSTYAVACTMSNKDGIERIIKATGKKEKKARMSLLCLDLKAVADHTLPYDNHIFKTMKRYLPGPYTFILNANNTVTKYFKNNKKEIGIRVPDNQIVLGLLAYLDEPIISTSVALNDDEEEEDIPNLASFEVINKHYQHSVDFAIDGQVDQVGETTVLDCTSGQIELVRQGLGKIE